MLAIDPSSPFTGGAILGDRVRMGDHALDDGVFIRSMATRGHLGGLAVATPQAARLLDAVGYDLVLIETVGVGQVEVEVAGEADTTVVVVNPGWGDAVQANKAGLMEIADVFVINKADRPGVERDPPRPRADARAVGAGSARRRATRAERDLAPADRGHRRHRRARGSSELWAAVDATLAPAGRLGRGRAPAPGRARRRAAAGWSPPAWPSGWSSCRRATPTSRPAPTSSPAGSPPGTAADRLLGSRRLTAAGQPGRLSPAAPGGRRGSAVSSSISVSSCSSSTSSRRRRFCIELMALMTRNMASGHDEEVDQRGEEVAVADLRVG